MLQKVEWEERRARRAPRRAIRNAIVVLLLILIPLTAQAVAPPRPGSGAAPPPTLPPAADKSTSAAAPAVGLHRLPVLAGGFSDQAGTYATSTLQDVFTGNQSVQDFWRAASSNRLEVVGEVASWQRMPETRTYYAGTDNGMDLWAAPHNAGRFVLDVVQAADQAGIDWARYDNDGPDGVANSGDDDGEVDCAIIIHAGQGGECGTSDLWSHHFFLGGWGYGAYTTSTRRHGGGYITVNDYVLVPEKSCSSGVIEIGVICHEYGHSLGLPDLYNTETGGAGIGGWGLMGTGSWGGDGSHPETPSLPSAWSRRELGWCTETVVVQDGVVSLPAISSEDRILVVREETMPDGEVFLVENRLQVGFDASLPGAGLLVWHVDGAVISATRSLNEVNAGTIPGLALEQADGLDQIGDAGDPWPGSSGAIRFAANTTPGSQTNTGARTDVVLSAILTARDPGGLFVEIGVVDLDVTPPSVQVIIPAGGEDWTLGDVVAVAWTASDAVGVVAVDLRLSHDGGATFPIRLAHGLANTGSWSGSLGTIPGAGVILKIEARDDEGNLGAATSSVFALTDRYAPGVALSGGPLAGVQLDPGDLVSFSWLTADNVGVMAVDLELSCDGGATWSATDVRDQPANGETVWTVPDMPCPLARLRVAARDAAGNVGWDQGAVFAINGGTTGVPDFTRLQLGPCIPNPFNPRAEIVFSLPAAGRVRLSVHDAAGRRVRVLLSEDRPAGRQSVIWDGRDGNGRGTASGVYWVRAEGPGGAAILKVTLIR